jgi:hypothetical protein
MSDLDEKINKAKEIYNKTVFLERGINYDFEHNELRLVENFSYIIGTINIFRESLEGSISHSTSLSGEILHYYNESRQKLTEMETKMERYSSTSTLSESELLRCHGVELHDDSKQQKQEIISGTIDPITYEDISSGQIVAYLVDKSNKHLMDKEKKRFPPPAFIYNEKNDGIRKLVLSSQTPKNPFTREKIQEVHLYTAEVFLF